MTDAGDEANAPYRAEYSIGWPTDREFLEPEPGAWDIVIDAVIAFVTRNPYLASYEVDESAGIRFMMTEESEFSDIPRLAVWFQPDDEACVVTFLTLQELPDIPDAPDNDMV